MTWWRRLCSTQRDVVDNKQPFDGLLLIMTEPQKPKRLSPRVISNATFQHNIEHAPVQFKKQKSSSASDEMM
jgi:hypothetical protein